jgi:hypothetical protein
LRADDDAAGGDARSRRLGVPPPDPRRAPTVRQRAHSLEKGGETFDLEAAVTEIRLTDVRPGPALDVIVLTRNKDFAEKDLPPLQFPAEVECSGSIRSSARRP